MAKSKSGGTRTYLRGRVGSDVYSIGKDAKGKKQQVVRSLAESVANPQTQAQMKGRMIMSTIAQVIAVLRPIIDHSFDNAVGARGNLSEFTQRNYALIKADIAAHPASGNQFGLNMYQERGAKMGAYVISDGAVSRPAAIELAPVSGGFNIALSADAHTVADLKAALGFGAEDYITLVAIGDDGKGYYSRLNIDQTVAGETEISDANVASIFVLDGNVALSFSYESNKIYVGTEVSGGNCGVIITKKTIKGFQHSECTLTVDTTPSYAADVALPTYPVGSERYLNGGDIFGGTVAAAPAAAPASQDSGNNGGGTSQNGGDSGSQSQSTHTLTMTKDGSGSVALTVNGSAISSGDSVADGATVRVEITPESEKRGAATINGVSIAMSQNDGKYVGTFSMPAQNSTLAVKTAEEPYSGGDDHNPIDTGN